MDYAVAAKKALHVQYASNLRGILSSMPDIMNAVEARRSELGESNAWRDMHPIVYMFSVQIGHLAGSALFASGDYDAMSDVCTRLSKGEEVEGY